MRSILLVALIWMAAPQRGAADATRICALALACQERWF
jgi:hypothetical protein